MFTTAGDTFLIIGDSEGTAISPTAAGRAARTGAEGIAAARTEATDKATSAGDFMPSILVGRAAKKPGLEPRFEPRARLLVTASRDFACGKSVRNLCIDWAQ